MAYTRAPMNDTHNVMRLTVSGENFVVSNGSEATLPTSLNYINCFPLRESQWHTEPRATIQKRQPWLRAINSTGSVSGNGSFQVRAMVPALNVDTYPNVFFIKHTGYYKYNYSTKDVTVLTTSTDAVYANGCNAVDSSNVNRIVFLDGGGQLKTWTEDGNNITSTDLSGLSINGTRGIVFLNGYLFAAKSDGFSIYNSTVGGVLTTWSSTDWISAEQYADPILWLDSHKNYLVVFGYNSIEFMYDGGVEVGSPLVRQEAYARKIGLYRESTGISTSKRTAKIGDDIYFLGVKDNDTAGLYVIRNFQVEEIPCPYLESILNSSSAEPATNVAMGVETMLINNIPMVLVNLSGSYSLVYLPDEKAWWMIEQGDPTVYDFPAPQYRIGTSWMSQNRGYSMFLSQNSQAATAIYQHRPDIAHTTSLTAVAYTPVIDMGNNFYKHCARVDAIGDFGNNTLTLAYNFTPNYEQTYTSCSPTRAPSSIGYGNNASWFNLGAFRRMSLKLTIAGTDHAVLEAFDIEYNAGNA
jgi:hypothetical protein